VPLGPQTILRGSHRLGVLPLEFSLGAGHRRAKLDERLADLEWVGGDFADGDIVIFHSLTVHQALPNTSGRMRLSVDYRFQREGEALTPGCLEPHFNRLTWDDIYTGWERDDLKYYWRTKRFDLVDWDPSLHAISEEEADAGMRDWMQWRRKHPRRDIDRPADWWPKPSETAGAAG
jgi:ectoine hydroxylase-related dioxygenase (phytanoyl-CoA dioxygenase family)